MTRTVYVNDITTWESAKDFAKSRGISLGSLVESALRRHMAEEHTQIEKVRRHLLAALAELS